MDGGGGGGIMKNPFAWLWWGAMSLLLMAVIGFVVFRFIPDVQATIERNNEEWRQTYAAWCKLEGRTDITYIEWTRLRQEGLLKHSGK